MKKQEYFNLIKKITKSIKGKGTQYNRVFSEPRKTLAGYRTKIWMLQGDFNNIKKVSEYITKEFGHLVTATATLGPKPGIPGSYFRNIIIIPKTPIKK